MLKTVRSPRASTVTLPDGRIVRRSDQVHVYTAPGRYWQDERGIKFFRVFGEPQPMPKKEIAIVNKRLMPIDRDYRTVTVPGRPKPFKWDIGYMKRWQEHVRRTVLDLMDFYHVLRYPPNFPISMGMLFYLTKPASSKHWLPSVKPDEDNLGYAVTNILKMTPGVTRQYENGQKYTLPGPFPDGILYFDDNQVCWHTEYHGKVWATADEPAGVLITVQDCQVIRDRIFNLTDPKRLTLL